MTNRIKFFSLIGAALLGFVFATFFYVNSPVIFGSVTTRVSTSNARELQTYSFFSATTTSATSTNLAAGGGYFMVAGAKKVIMYFGRGGLTDPNVGTSTFRVQVTPDGSNWYDFGLLLSATSSSQTTYPLSPTYGSVVVISKSITAGGNGTTTIPRALNLDNFPFLGVRCIVYEDTDGEHTCTAQAEF